MANEEMLEYFEGQRKKRDESNLFFEELAEREKNLQEQLAHQQAVISQQEALLNENRSRLKKEQMLREKEFQKELEEQGRLFELRQEQLFQRQKQMEQTYLDRLAEAEDLRVRFENELSSRETALRVAEEELGMEKLKYSEESRRQMEVKSQSYVNNALSGLEKKEKNFHVISSLWSILGAFSIIFGITFLIYTTLNSANSFHSGAGLTWTYFVFVTLRGLIVVTLFAALAKYSFIFSKSYMHESLKNSERRHAINFGKFYLEAFGANASWLQIKEAFQHWNIGNDSAFSKDKVSISSDEKNDAKEPGKNEIKNV